MQSTCSRNLFWNRTAIAVLGVTLLVSCERQDHPELHGSLYFGAGDYLAELDLRNGNTSVVASIGNDVIQGISRLDESRLLLSVFGSVNQRGSHRLVLFELETKQRLTFFEGRFGSYLPGASTLVYDDGSSIWVTWKNGGDWEKVEVAQHRYNSNVKILPLTGNRFLYKVEGEVIYLFDVASRQSAEMAELEATCGLEAALWSAERDKLLCKIQGAGHEHARYAFVGLDGTVHETLSLPTQRPYRAVAFLPDQQALILTERWQGWFNDRYRQAVWVFHFDTSGAWRLLEDQPLGESVIYSDR